MLIHEPQAILAALFLAMLLDAVFGEPPILYRHLPHPVVAIGRLITGLERILWREGQGPRGRLVAGGLAAALTLTLATAPIVLLQGLLGHGVIATLVYGALASTLLAQKSLVEHVAAVSVGLTRSLHAGRVAVSRIVGRDSNALDGSGVARAAIESAAENQSDAVTAPWLWFLVAGLPGLVAYKTINTLDSMIGYRSERYLYYGRVAARLDDLVNLFPARLAAMAILVVGLPPRRWHSGWSQVCTWAPRHRSPNAGWPEAATATALDIRLAGPRVYPSGMVDDAFIGDGRTELRVGDIDAAIRLLWRTWALLWGLTVCALVGVAL